MFLFSHSKWHPQEHSPLWLRRLVGRLVVDWLVAWLVDWSGGLSAGGCVDAFLVGWLGAGLCVVWGGLVGLWR